jgi:hypothetical protein
MLALMRLFVRNVRFDARSSRHTKPLENLGCCLVERPGGLVLLLISCLGGDPGLEKDVTRETRKAAY